ncbi:prostasin-like [Anticarsia gemmatalis]|uniref:prostasin-like n=1 Tax=Anticarsia gemmatalis TaxID=129554 RepID=UPI003F762B54
MLSFLLISFAMLWEVNSMALKGPALTRYDPCGLGLLHFDRISENNWRGVLHFGLYANLVEAVIEMEFKEETIISAHQTPYNITAKRTSQKDLIIHVMAPIPNTYTFFVTLKHFNANESDVPVVNQLMMNKVALCNEQIKAAQTITSLNVSEKYAGRHAHICGRRSIDHEELVSVRTEAKPGDWPWHVAIFVRDANNVLKYECGGNIVSSTAIVTAGHCVYKNGFKIGANRLVIVAGSSSHKDINHVGRQVLNAQEVILHPAFNINFSTADLAVIRVNTLRFTEYVQPICVWGPVYDKTKLFGSEATVVGFGSTEFNKQSDVLRSTYIMVQNDTTCVSFSPKVYGYLLNEFTFCAGYGPTSSINPRNGDSGGGLVVPAMQYDHKISWFLRGVLSKCGVSAGHKDCDPRYYVVYTDVGPHYSWIYHHAGLEFRSNVVTTH